MSHQIIARTTQATIVALEPDLAETIRVVLEVDDSEFEFLAGQWLNLGVWMDGELKVGGYSFASSPSELPRFELGIKDSARNPVSRYFHRDAAVGDSVTVDGGHGPCVYVPDEDVDLVLIAGGIGLTPMLSIARTFASNDAPHTLKFLYSASKVGGFAFHDAVMELEEDDRITVELIETDGSEAVRHETLTRALKGGTSAAFYLCGPSGMVDDLSLKLRSEGVLTSHIRFEKWW